MTCPRCKHSDIAITTHEETQRTGCFTILLYIFLAITILGLLIVIPLWLRGKKTRSVTTCICKNCGNKWTI